MSVRTVHRKISVNRPHTFGTQEKQPSSAHGRRVRQTPQGTIISHITKCAYLFKMTRTHYSQDAKPLDVHIHIKTEILRAGNEGPKCAWATEFAAWARVSARAHGDEYSLLFLGYREKRR